MGVARGDGLSIEETRLEVQGGKLGVFVGAGGYADDLLRDLRGIGLEPLEYSWTHDSDERRFVRPDKFKDVVETLQEDGVTDVLHAGTVTFGPMMWAAQRILMKRQRVPDVLMMLRALRRTHFGPLQTRLEEAGLRVRTATDLFDKYRANQGVMGSNVLTASDLSAVVALKEPVRAELAKSQTFFGATHAAIWEGDRVVERETFLGTSGVCRAASKRPKHARRILIKIAPAGPFQQLDLPTIGTNTISEARAAGVDVVALECSRGLVIDRELTAKRADELGVVLVGI